MITIIKTIPEHLEEFFEIFASHPGTIEDYLGFMPKDFDSFRTEYQARAKNSITLIYENQITMFGFLEHIHPGYAAYAVMVKRRGYPGTLAMRGIIREIRKRVFPRWFEKWDLEKLCAIAREKNTLAIRLETAMGFHVDGHLRHHEKVNGTWIDCLLLSILKEELS